MRAALDAYLDRAARGDDHATAVVAGAEAVAADPWDVVHLAGRLARARRRVATEDVGLTATLRTVAPGARGAMVRIDAGQPYPSMDRAGRRSRGAFDTPKEMARQVVASALAAAEGTVKTGLDSACGTGAFLVAMFEAGIPQVYGTDVDPVAIDIARVAVPRALLHVDDALKHGPTVDVVCGNPPFVPPERQDKQMRMELRRRFPWLRGRFDLVVPFAATAADRVRQGGGLGLVLPYPALVQPYGAVLRRRWVQRHRITELSGPHPFPGASVHVGLVAAQVGQGPAPVPAHGITPEELLRLETVPLNPALQPGDVHLVERMRYRSRRLGDLCLVDTGLVAHGPAGGKARLIHDEPGDGRVRYADAKEFFSGSHRWIQYKPEEMHRPKTPEMFETDKIVVQRIRGRGPVRAAVDRDKTYVGHTCTVVVPRVSIDLDRLLILLQSPLIDALTRIERGERLDLYPRDVAAIPVPIEWLADPDRNLQESFGLKADEVRRLLQVSAA